MPASTSSLSSIGEVPVMALNQKLLLAGARLQAQTFKAAMRYQVEMLGFLKHRCEQDMKLLDNFLDSEEMGDAFGLWSNFMRNAVTEYTAEAGKIVSMGSKLTASMGPRAARHAAEPSSGANPAKAAG